MQKMPSNWKMSKIGDVAARIQYGHTASSRSTGNVRFLRITDIQNDRVQWDDVPYCEISEKEYEKYALTKDDIVFVRTGATVGKSFLIEDVKHKSVFASYLIRFTLKEGVLPRYIKYFFNSPLYWNQIFENAAGIGQPNFNSTKLANIVFPLPPLPEQKRIVAKLDTLFAHLDQLRSRLDKIPVLLKQFRQAVLRQAVTGKLTEEWRGDGQSDKNYKVPISWQVLTIDNLLKSLKTDLRTGPFGSALKKGEHLKDGVPVWGIESIGENGVFTWKNKIFVSKEKSNELRSFEVKAGDIIISRSGTVGEICLLPENLPFSLISTNLMKIVLDRTVILPLYFCWLFKASPVISERLSDLCKGSTRLFLTQSILKQIQYIVPPVEEQHKIVDAVKSFFSVADRVEQDYQLLKDKINLLPQAILSKAFRGELSN